MSENLQPYALVFGVSDFIYVDLQIQIIDAMTLTLGK